MKATIDIDDALYRQLKIEAARRGCTIRELVAEGLRHVLGWPSPTSRAVREQPAEWYGALSQYAANAKGKHDLASVRGSIAKGRTRRS
jgi:hypothetical protein